MNKITIFQLKMIHKNHILMDEHVNIVIPKITTKYLLLIFYFEKKRQTYKKKKS